MSQEAILTEYRLRKMKNIERTLANLTTQVEEVQEIIRVRDLEIFNLTKIILIIIENVIIIKLIK